MSTADVLGGRTTSRKPVERTGINASPGTGRIYRLVTRYLDLVLAGVDPSTILLATHTRLAATEIRDRVLSDLASLVLDPTVRGRANHVNRFRTAGTVAQENAEEALAWLVARPSDLRICTLDSMFVRLARGVGTAPGIAAEATLGDQATLSKLLREAVKETIQALGQTEALDTLETLRLDATKTKLISEVEPMLLGAALALADQTSATSWHWPHPSRDEVLIERLRALHTSLEAAHPELGIAQAEAVAKVQAQLVDAMDCDGAIWMAIANSTIVAAAGPEGSGTYSRSPIDPSILPALGELHAMACEGNLRNLARRTGALRHFLDELAPRYRLAKRRARVADFDDYTRVLDPRRGGIDPAAFDELCFRLDARVEHLLLDEFQDTSASQLRAIRPLTQEILSDGERPRSLLVVGDVKQSIYGWRGADPAIHNGIGAALETDESAMPVESLDRSYRSSPAVIELVNTVFDDIRTNAAVLASSPQAAEDFARIWTNQSAGLETSGEAIVKFLPDPDGEDELSVLASAAADSAVDLVERDPQGRVAVIAGSYQAVGAIMEELRARGVEAHALVPGSFLDTEAATAFIQAFRLAADPDDRVAAEDLARGPLGPLVGIAAAPNASDQRIGDVARRSAGVRLRHRLDRDGPAAVVDDWRRTLAGVLTRREATRLRQMVETLEAFDTQPGLPRSPRAIERHLRSCGAPNLGGEGVVVTTVERSKGLEFDGVVVTELETPLFHKPDLAVGNPVAPAEQGEKVAIWCPENARPASAAGIHQETTDRIVFESLCRLFVAMTRATRDLVIQVPRPVFTRDGDPVATNLPTWGGVVRCAINRQDSSHAVHENGAERSGSSESESTIASMDAGSETVLRILHGNPAPSDAESSTGDAPRSSSPRQVSITPPKLQIREFRSNISRSGLRSNVRISERGRPRGESAWQDPIALPGRDDLDRRRAIRAVLKSIDLADGKTARDDEALYETIRAHVPHRDPRWHRDLTESIRVTLKDRRFFEAFDGGPSTADAEIRIDLPFVMTDGQKMRSGLIDRVVIRFNAKKTTSTNHEPDGVVSVSIFDFSTPPARRGENDPRPDPARCPEHLLGAWWAIAAQLDVSLSQVSAFLVADDLQLVRLKLPESLTKSSANSKTGSDRTISDKILPEAPKALLDAMSDLGNPGTYRMLLAIHNAGQMNRTELAEATDVSLSRASRAMAAFEDHGWVQSVESEDSRQKLVRWRPDPKLPGLEVIWKAAHAALKPRLFDQESTTSRSALDSFQHPGTVTSPESVSADAPESRETSDPSGPSTPQSDEAGESTSATTAPATLPADQEITLAEATKWFSTSRRTLERLRQRGHLHGVRKGRSLRIRAADVQAAIRNHGPIQMREAVAEFDRDERSLLNLLKRFGKPSWPRTVTRTDIREALEAERELGNRPGDSGPVVDDHGRPRPFLSKTDVVLGCECPCKVWHRRNGLDSRDEDDAFMHLLANEEFMFERLVRQAWPGEDLSRSRQLSKADLTAMAAKLRGAIKAGKGTLHQVTVEHAGLRSRIDMVRVVGRRIELCEIKARGIWAAPDDRVIPHLVLPDHPGQDGRPQITSEGRTGEIRNTWIKDLRGIAFQAMILREVVSSLGREFHDVVVVPRLVLVNTAVRGRDRELDGFANMVPVSDREHGCFNYDFVNPSTEGERSPIIVEVDVADLCDDLEADAGCMSATFRSVGWRDLQSVARNLLAEVKSEDPSFPSMAVEERGLKCARCEFNLGRPGDGFSRCWGDRAESARSLMSLYHGSQYQGLGKSENWVDIAIDGDILDVKDLPHEEGEGTRQSIRARQIDAERSGRVAIALDGGAVIRTKLAPTDDPTVLWFVDFETTTGCLPHYEDVKPYEVVPFQFSVHAVPVRNGLPVWGGVEHREWLFDDRQSGDGIDLDLDFVEALADALTRPVDGIDAVDAPVFHWSSHERAILDKIRTRFKTRGGSLPADRRDAAIAFLDSMIKTNEADRAGGRLVDMMTKAAEPSFFHPLQKGSFSLKRLLPAICSNSRYRDMIRRLAPELAADGGSPVPDGVWDPYKLLPPVSKSLAGPRAKDDGRADDDGDANEFGDLQCGTDAMRAFAQLRYRRDERGQLVGDDQARAIRQALLRYCRLDTAAMVVVWAFMMELANDASPR